MLNPEKIWCQIFSRFNTPKVIKIGYFWQSYLKNKKVNVFRHTVYYVIHTNYVLQVYLFNNCVVQVADDDDDKKSKGMGSICLMYFLWAMTFKAVVSYWKPFSVSILRNAAHVTHTVKRSHTCALDSLLWLCMHSDIYFVIWRFWASVCLCQSIKTCLEQWASAWWASWLMGALGQIALGHCMDTGTGGAGLLGAWHGSNVPDRPLLNLGSACL